MPTPRGTIEYILVNSFFAIQNLTKTHSKMQNNIPGNTTKNPVAKEIGLDFTYLNLPPARNTKFP